MVEFVATLNDTIWDANLMFGMWQRLGGGGQQVEFDFTGCRFLRQNAVAFLGGLARLIEHRGGEVISAGTHLSDTPKASIPAILSEMFCVLCDLCG
jgi:hypothetical protein